METIKRSDIRWKWLQERGFNVLNDRHQYAYIQALWASPEIVQAVFCEAKAGTGKTTIAVLAGAYAVEGGEYERIIYVRNALPIRELGYLPGSLEEKEAPYFAPLMDALENVQPGTYEKWTREGCKKIVVLTTAFARGINWNNSFVIIDEAQSFDLEELQAVYTRCADTCKVVTVGSLRQNDNKRITRYAGLTPFELYMRHFVGKKVTYHKLVTNYRGSFASWADEIQLTVNTVKEEEIYGK